MTYDPNDPRLTAYALGELDESDRPAIEAQLAEDPESRRAVAEICEVAKLLTGYLRTEPSPGLAAEQKRVIEQQLRPEPSGRFRVQWLGLAAAAALLIAGVGLLLPAV